MSVTVSVLAPLAGPTLWGFLEKAPTIRLATVGLHGSVVVSPAWFVAREETVFVALDPVIGDPGRTTTSDAVHVRNVRDGGVVAGVVDLGSGTADRHGVRFEGTGTIVEDPRLIDELLDLVAEKYFYSGHPHLEFYFSSGAVAERRWCRLEPATVEGWDLRQLPQPPVSDLLVFPAGLAQQTWSDDT